VVGGIEAVTADCTRIGRHVLYSGKEALIMRSDEKIEINFFRIL
jgi:hypothetical protein